MSESRSSFVVLQLKNNGLHFDCSKQLFQCSYFSPFDQFSLVDLSLTYLLSTSIFESFYLPDTFQHILSTSLECHTVFIFDESYQQMFLKGMNHLSHLTGGSHCLPRHCRKCPVPTCFCSTLSSIFNWVKPVVPNLFVAADRPNPEVGVGVFDCFNIIINVNPLYLYATLLAASS